MSATTQVIAAIYPDREHAKTTLDMLQRMHRAVTITLLDAALITKDEHGKVKVEETTELTVGKGARRGAVITGVLGLIYPPGVIVSALAGGAIGALAGRLRDTGVKHPRLEAIADRLDPGKAAVVALADGASVLPIQHALVGYEGTLVTEPLDETALKELYIAEGGGVGPDPASESRTLRDPRTIQATFEQAREGMEAVDAAGETIGTISFVTFGDPVAAAEVGTGGPRPTTSAAVALDAKPEPDVPAVLAARLLRAGYVKIDDKRRLRPDHHYYAAADEIASVGGGAVRLSLTRDDLLTPGG